MYFGGGIALLGSRQRTLGTDTAMYVAKARKKRKREGGVLVENDYAAR